MPSHHYERVPLDDDTSHPTTQNPTYFTGLPTTAPPSFHTIELPSSTFPIPSPTPTFPHRNDETAATFIPHMQRPSPAPVPPPQTLISETDDPAISIWAPSDAASSRELNSVREDLLVRLMDRVEAIEERLAVHPPPTKGEFDLEAANEKRVNKKWWSEFWTGVLIFVVFFLFFLWFGAVLVLTSHAKHGGGKGGD